MHPGVAVPKPHYEQSSALVEKLADNRHASAMAAFDLKKDIIVVRDNWDCDRKYDQSFLVHEMVHHFQKAMKVDCAHNVEGCEAQAYALQDIYMHE
jgi:hypothetical protein